MEVEQTGTEPVPIWDVSIVAGSLTPCATKLNTILIFDAGISIMYLAAHLFVHVHPPSTCQIFMNINVFT